MYASIKNQIALQTCMLCVIPSLAQAADHTDAPAVIADPAADLTDVYAWTSTTHLNLALNVPAAEFSDAVQYVFHLEVAEAYGADGTSTSILCEFDAEQSISCWLGEDTAYVSGDASDEAGISNEDGTFRVFSGPRNDPFFFNLTGFNATIAAVVDAANDGLATDEAGCPQLDADVAGSLAQQLALEANGDPAQNDFSASVSALVIQVDLSLIGAEDSVVAVWASTRR